MFNVCIKEAMKHIKAAYAFIWTNKCLQMYFHTCLHTIVFISYFQSYCKNLCCYLDLPLLLYMLTCLFTCMFISRAPGLSTSMFTWLQLQWIVPIQVCLNLCFVIVYSSLDTTNASFMQLWLYSGDIFLVFKLLSKYSNLTFSLHQVCKIQ